MAVTVDSGASRDGPMTFARRAAQFSADQRTKRRQLFTRVNLMSPFDGYIELAGVMSVPVRSYLRNTQVGVMIRQVHGVGRTRALLLLAATGIEPDRKIGSLSDEERRTLARTLFTAAGRSSRTRRRIAHGTNLKPAFDASLAVRSTGARVRAELAALDREAGAQALAYMLRDGDRRIEHFDARSLICSLRGFGPARAAECLTHIGGSGKRIRELTPGQRVQLANDLIEVAGVNVVSGSAP